MARVYGVVVAAANPSQTLPNVQVSITSITSSRVATHLAQTTTDANGNYDIPNVIVSTGITPLTMTVTPTDPQYRSQAITFNLPGGQSADVLIALVPASVTNSGKTVTLSVSASSVPVNMPLHIKALVPDAQVPLLPNLLYTGSAGTLSTTGFEPDGSDAIFVPSATGTGTVTALLWNGASSPPLPIQATPSASPTGPPSPPTSSTKATAPLPKPSHG